MIEFPLIIAEYECDMPAIEPGPLRLAHHVLHKSVVGGMIGFPLNS